MTRELKALDLAGRFLPPGEVIVDRFKIGEKIGEGPFGQVYKADDMLIESKVTVKIFAEDLLATPVQEEQFLKATRRARAMTQKNVVRLHASGIHRDYPWVSMQYLEGLNLRKVARLRRQRDETFGLGELEPIISQVTLALQHIGRDHPHGNLKPENILLLPELVKVTDGYILAALPDDEFARRNGDNPFIAPELQSPGRAPDVQCDVYSVGATIGYMLFGEDYEPGSHSNAPGALSAVDALCKRAMAFDPSERYPSVEELNEDFTSIVDTGARLDSTSSTAASAPVDSGGQKPAKPEVAPDPLDVETSPDIGESETAPPAQPTQEADELVDYLPTNEVSRDEHPAPSDEHPAPSEPPARSESANEPPSTQPPASQEPETTDKSAKKTPETSPSTGRTEGPAPKKKKAKKKKKSGLLVAILALFAIIGLVVVAGGIGFAGFFFLSSDEDPTAVAEPPEISAEQHAAQEPSPDPVDTAAQAAEEEDEVDEQAEQFRQELKEALAAASVGPLEARDTALERAGERAEELEEEQREQDAASGAGAAPGGAAAPAPQPTECPSNMVRISVSGEYVCVDAYQYPGRGQMPEVNVSWFDARRLCDQQDKRLCTIQEWRAACGGQYPYGGSYDADRCNTQDSDGFERSLAEAGSFPQCRSPSGAYDMSGNVHEWVEEQRVAGGGYDSGPELASCRYSSAMSPGSSRGTVGFRCCASPS